MKVILIAATTIVAVWCSVERPARAVDLDCALLLCIPGGFPNDGEGVCSSAKSYMLDRLREGKPPIGTCTMSDGKDYKDFGYTMGRHYYCDAGLTLAVRDDDADSGVREVPDGEVTALSRPGCYTKTAKRAYRCEGSYGHNGTDRCGWKTEYTYLRRSDPKGGRYIDITMQLDSAGKYDSGKIYY
jgi:hypothetical protein